MRAVLQRTSERSKDAGLFRFGAFAEITEESVHDHYNINVLGTILTERRRIINRSSIVGSHPVAGAMPYCPRKAPSKR